MKTAATPVLDIAYEESGPADGRPVVLLHGFPDDIHAYGGVAPPLAAAGFRVIVPYLRGYGPTRFRDTGTPRSGQQAALGHDLLDLIDALALKTPLLAGYDWGGRAACVVSALWPDRVGGLVSITGYNIQNIANSGRPQPEAEYRHWYLPRSPVDCDASQAEEFRGSGEPGTIKRTRLKRGRVRRSERGGLAPRTGARRPDVTTTQDGGGAAAAWRGSGNGIAPPGGGQRP